MQRSLNIHDIKQALRPSQSQDALKAVQVKLSIKPGELISPQDQRLLVVKLWLDEDSAAQDLFNLWEQLRDMSTEALVVSLFSTLLSLLASHYPFHSYATPIIKKIFSQQWLRRLHAYLTGSHNEQILATLKLFNTVSAFAGGQERKLVLEAFPWDNKNISKLLSMRRRGKKSNAQDMLDRPDIRTLYILLILSMVDRNSVSWIKVKFLEQHCDVFSSIFKGLIQDDHSVVQKVLQVCWEGLWSDPKVSRTLKLSAFNEATILHILKLYDRTAVETQGGDHVLADVAHHFLLAICTSPGQGLCFRDRGWYPREVDENKFAEEEDAEVEDNNQHRRKGRYLGKIYNKILASILPVLKVNEDARQQELALKITAACPELVAGYWSTAALSLEPRLSSKWIANFMFVGQVISHAVPTSSFLLSSSSDLYMPTPPPFATIMANVLPSVATRTLFTKGLQFSSSAVVRHCTALVLAKCLCKLAQVVRAFKAVEITLEEDDDGLWSRRRKEIETEARRRVPDVQVIIAFWQQSSTMSANSTMQALLSESAHRLLSLYQGSLPEVVAEVRFEVGKLVMSLAHGSLSSHSSDDSVDSLGQVQQGNVSIGLQNATQLHVLRLLRGSDQFTLAGKATSSSHSYFHVLLNMYCNTRVHALRTMLQDLLQHVLARSVLFQEDPVEVEIWLAALPSGSVRRGKGTEAPDGAPLTDEVDAVVTFLDDCTQQCLKTPYHYIEAMSNLVHARTSTTVDIHHQEETFASPLIMTVLEQLTAKVNGKSMSPSDALAVFAFMRRLLVMLSGKQEDARYVGLHAIVDQLNKGIGGQPFPEYPSISFGIRRELSIMIACLRHLREETCHQGEQPSDGTVAHFLDRVEQVAVPTSETARMTSAFELIDWLRLVDANPSSSDISRLASVVQRLHEPALLVLVDYLHPSGGHAWDSDILKLASDRFLSEDRFGWLYCLSKPRHLRVQRIRNALVGMLYSRPSTYTQVERSVRLIIHGISLSLDRHDLLTVLLALLSDVLVKSSGVLADKDVRHLKASVVIQSACIHALCISEDLASEVHEGIRELVEACIDCTDEEDNKLVSSLSSHWSARMSEAFSSGQLDTLSCARPWIKFMHADQLIASIDVMHTGVDADRSPVLHETLEEILASLRRWMHQDPDVISKLSVHKLLELLGLFPESTLLENMLSVTLTSQLPAGFDGNIALSKGQPMSSLFSGMSSSQSSELRFLHADLISRFLNRETWTESTAKVIIALLYTNVASTRAYATWLDSGRWKRTATRAFAATLAAFLDCTALMGGDLSQFNDEVLHDLLEELFPREPSQEEDEPRSVECVAGILALAGSRRQQLVSMLQKRLQEIPIMDLTLETTLLARKVHGMSGSETLTTTIMDRALQWAVRHVAGDVADSENSNKALDNLKYLAECQTAHKSHLVEPFMAIAIQHRLSHANVVELAVELANRTQFKPVIVNRFLQNILQHPHFSAICGRDKSTHEKDQIIRLLDVLFHLHPANTCQPSHVEPVFHIYGGTMSASDRRLLGVMRLFEAETRESLSAFFVRWSPSSDATVTNALEVIQNFDPVKMLRTCLAFPSWRQFGEEKPGRDSPVDDSIYNPLVVIVLSGQMLVECPPTTALGWVKVFRSNVVSLLIRCLSSKDANIRQAALSQTARLWESIQRSDMQEGAQVIYVLRLLKNVIPRPANPEEAPRRLSTYTSLILLHALRGIFYPSNFIYPHTAYFLLQRPELDVSDVHMLFGLLYSTSDDWKKERSWMLKMLADGMVDADDWKVLKRRHTWELIASLFQSSPNDIAARTWIFEILANLTCDVQACTSLVLKSSILSWIEMQVGVDSGKESIAWVRILENIILMADVSKLNRATGGEWCSTICRILSIILRSKEKMLGVLRQSSVVLLRLSLIQQIPDHALHGPLSHAVEYLLHLEPSIDIHRLQLLKRSTPVLPPPPHRAQGLKDMPPTEASLQAWGEIVEALWRVAMSLGDRTRPWIMLTRRLLVWRALVGDETCPVGEWARREVIRIGRIDV